MGSDASASDGSETLKRVIPQCESARSSVRSTVHSPASSDLELREKTV